MGQKRPLIFLGFAVGIALVTTVLIYQWLQGQQGSEPEVQAVVEFEGTGIAVASVDVPWGTALTAELIRFVDFQMAHCRQVIFKSLKRWKGGWC